jgi:hypothetical protein
MNEKLGKARTATDATNPTDKLEGAGATRLAPYREGKLAAPNAGEEKPDEPETGMRDVAEPVGPELDAATVRGPRRPKRIGSGGARAAGGGPDCDDEPAVPDSAGKDRPGALKKHMTAVPDGPRGPYLLHSFRLLVPAR